MYLLRQPYVLDDTSHLKNACGIAATFGVSDNAPMDVLTGKFKPQGNCRLRWRTSRKQSLGRILTHLGTRLAIRSIPSGSD